MKALAKSIPQPGNENWESGHAIMAWSTAFRTGCDWVQGCRIWFREVEGNREIDTKMVYSKSIFGCVDHLEVLISNLEYYGRTYRIMNRLQTLS